MACVAVSKIAQVPGTCANRAHMVVATMQAAHVRQAARQSSEQPPSQTMPATMIAAYFAFLFVGNVGDQLANTLGGLQEASRVADTMWGEGRRLYDLYYNLRRPTGKYYSPHSAAPRPSVRAPLSARATWMGPTLLSCLALSFESFRALSCMMASNPPYPPLSVVPVR